MFMRFTTVLLNLDNIALTEFSLLYEEHINRSTDSDYHIDSPNIQKLLKLGLKELDQKLLTSLVNSKLLQAKYIKDRDEQIKQAVVLMELVDTVYAYDKHTSFLDK